MNLFQTISAIKPVTKFQKKPVDENMIGLMLHMATYSFSAGNVQEWEFIVVEDDIEKKKLAEAALKQKHVMDAPTNIVVCANLGKISLKYGLRGELAYSLEDTFAAASLIVLTANAMGLGSDMVRAFDEEVVKGILGLPDNIRPVVIIPVGYPAEDAEKEGPKKIPFEELTHVNRYGNKIQIQIKPFLNQLEDKLNQIQKLQKQEKSDKDTKKFDFQSFLKKISS